MWPLLLLYYAGVVTVAGISLPGAGGGNYGERKIIMFHHRQPLPECHQIIRRQGGRVVRELPLVHALVARWPQKGQAIEQLAVFPEVLVIEDDFQVRTVATVSPAAGTQRSGRAGGPHPPVIWMSPLGRSSFAYRFTPGTGLKPAVTWSSLRVRQKGQTIPWGVERIGAPAAWQGVSGAKVKVAVLDTGIDARHPDLAANVRGAANIKFPGWQAGDGNGHGTHVAGTIAAGNNNYGVVGVAPGAEVYAVKIFNRQGNGYISDIIAGLDWAAKNGMQVVNMSFGTTRPSRPLEEAVRQCVQAGLVLVAAAGNEGKDNSVMYPARYPGVIAVSAIDQKDKLANFSSRGPEVMVTAPGVDILSTYPGGKYRTMSGTSMACPHVAGVAALVLSNNSRIPGRQVARLIARMATRLPDLTPEEQGAGLVNASFLASARYSDEAGAGHLA